MIYFKSIELLHKTLVKNDVVVFQIENKKYAYVVSDDKLESSCFRNDIIFRKLNLNKNLISTQTYGYFLGDYQAYEWPYCFPQDYKALTRLTIKLLQICEEKRYLQETYNIHMDIFI